MTNDMKAQKAKDENLMTILPVMDGGVFQRKLSHAIQDIALACVVDETASNKGKLTIELDVQRIGESQQVTITHKMKTQKPTRRGKSMEEDTTETPFFVGYGGHLGITPEDSANGQRQMNADGFKLQEDRG